MAVKQEHYVQNQNNEQCLKALMKKRKQIVQRISQLSKRRYFLLAQPKHKEVESAEGEPRKMVKRQSKQSQQGDKFKIEQRIPSSTSLPDESETIQKIKQQSMQRSKRLFQGLNSYLDKAKTKLQQQKQKREQTNKLLEKAQQKEKEKSMQLVREELQRINTELNSLEKAKDENARQILKIQNKMLLASYTQYANQVKNFNFTKAQPAVSWKPATKELEVVARKWLGQQDQSIEEKNNKIIESIQKYESKFDYSIYIYQNQQQYYENMLRSYYLDNQDYMRTKHEPAIYWKPACNLQKLNQHKIVTGKLVDSILEDNKKKCQQFYNARIAVIKEKRGKGLDANDNQDELNQSHSGSHPKQEQD